MTRKIKKYTIDDVWITNVSTNGQCAVMEIRGPNTKGTDTQVTINVSWNYVDRLIVKLRESWIAERKKRIETIQEIDKGFNQPI